MTPWSALLTYSMRSHPLTVLWQIVTHSSDRLLVPSTLYFTLPSHWRHLEPLRTLLESASSLWSQSVEKWWATWALPSRNDAWASVWHASMEETRGTCLFDSWSDTPAVWGSDTSVSAREACSWEGIKLITLIQNFMTFVVEEVLPESALMGLNSVELMEIGGRALTSFTNLTSLTNLASRLLICRMITSLIEPS